MQIRTLCLCHHGHDPNLTTSLCTFMTPPSPSRHPPLPFLNANTHAGIRQASALSSLVNPHNANLDNLVNKCFVWLPEMDALGNGKILGKRGVANQTNSGPLFPMGLSMTGLPAEVDGTAKGTFLEGAKGASIFPTSSLSTQRAYNCHITSNIYIFSSLTT